MKMNLEKSIASIRRFFKKNRRMPTYEELCSLFRFSSKLQAFRLVNKLIKAGFVEKDSKGRISLTQTVFPLPMLGFIRAGQPDDAQEQFLGTLTFDDYLVDHPDSSYVLKVSGDSMIEAGIYEGDTVVVDKAKRPKIGDIVVANVDNEYTLKYLQKIDSKSILMPANGKYPPIVPRDSLMIEGVVVSVIRKYR